MPPSYRETGRFGSQKATPPPSNENNYFFRTKSLQQQEHDALSALFGREYTIPPPPRELFTTMDAMKKKETKGRPCFIPQPQLIQDSGFPGWTPQFGDWFWSAMNGGKISKDSITTPGCWTIFDATPKTQTVSIAEPRNNWWGGDNSDYYSSYSSAPKTVTYPDDHFVGNLLSHLRSTKEISLPHDTDKEITQIPENSRLGLSRAVIKKIVLPTLASLLYLPLGVQVKLPNPVESSFFNARQQNQDGGNVGEWLDGNYAHNGLYQGLFEEPDHSISTYPTSTLNPRLGFRFMITFPSAR